MRRRPVRAMRPWHRLRVPDAVRHSSCRSAEPGPYQAPAFFTAPALQRTTPLKKRRAALRPGHEELDSRGEIRREASLDVFRDLVGGAVFGVAEGALAGEALELAGDVVGHAGERGAGHHRPVGDDLDQVVLRVDAVIFA